jgi:hypothetical protein
VTREDIFGCLFFYARDLLLEFTKRLRRFKISIILTQKDARELAGGITTIPGLFPVNTFDRIDVANILERDSVGIPGVLTEWGPLLNRENPRAAIVGHIDHWVSLVPGGSVTNSSMDVIRKALFVMENTCSVRVKLH